MSLEASGSWAYVGHLETNHAELFPQGVHLDSRRIWIGTIGKHTTKFEGIGWAWRVYIDAAGILAGGNLERDLALFARLADGLIFYLANCSDYREMGVLDSRLQKKMRDTFLAPHKLRGETSAEEGSNPA